MAVLDIQDTLLSQMQRLTIVFTPQTDENETVTIHASNGTHTFADTVSVIKSATDSNDNPVYIVRTTTPLQLNQTYQVYLSTDTETGATSNIVTAVPVFDNSTKLQQAIYDVCTANVMLDRYDRIVTFLENGLFVPEDITDGESISVTIPFVAVGKAKVNSLETIGLNLNMVTHEIEIKIADEPIDSNVNDVSHLHNIGNQIVNRLLAVSDLGLHNWGLKKNCMTFSLENIDSIADDDSLNSVLLKVEITQLQTI